MSAPAATLRHERHRPRPKREPIVYRVVSEPGKDPERGEEALLRWLAERLSE
jgi:hypothetical protein